MHLNCSAKWNYISNKLCVVTDKQLLYLKTHLNLCLHILIPPFPIQTLVDSWHGETWIERFCNHYSVNIRKSSYFIVYSNWSNSRYFFIVFMTLGISIACFHLHRLVSLLTFVGIRSCQISNLVKVNTHNKYSESSVKILSKIMSKLQ